MYKLKKLIVILLLISLCSCSKYDYKIDTVIYNLDIDNTYKENIVFTLPPNVEEIVEKRKIYTSTSIEESLLKEDFDPLYYNYNINYNKKINKSSNKVEVVLDYEYLEKDFIYSSFSMQCFENYDFTIDKNYFEAHLSGKFYCLNDKTIEINVKSVYKVIDTNGDNNDGKYTWSIDENNYDDVDIYYKISRDYNNMLQQKENNNITYYLKYAIVLVVTIVVLIIIYKFYKRKKEEGSI